MTKHKPNPIDVLDTIFHEAALVESERGKRSPEQMRWARGVVSDLKARVAEKRRAMLPPDEARKKAKPISAWLLGLDREALLAKLADFARRGPAVQVAHRNLRGLSDDDLRRIIDLIDPDGTNDSNVTTKHAPDTKE